MAIPDLTTTAGALDVFSATIPAAWLGAETIAGVVAGVMACMATAKTYAGRVACALN